VGGNVVSGAVCAWVEIRVKETGCGFTLRTVCMRRRVGPLSAGDPFCPGVADPQIIVGSRHVIISSGHDAELKYERVRNFVMLSSNMRELAAHDREGDGLSMGDSGRGRHDARKGAGPCAGIFCER
jgi:hypothetical protein